MLRALCEGAERSARWRAWSRTASMSQRAHTQAARGRARAQGLRTRPLPGPVNAAALTFGSNLSNIQPSPGFDWILGSCHHPCSRQVKLTSMAEKKPSHTGEKNGDGTTALHAAARGGHLAVVELLLEHGAQPELADAQGNTALMLACRHGHADVVNALLNASSQFSKSTGHGARATAVLRR